MADGLGAFRLETGPLLWDLRGWLEMDRPMEDAVPRLGRTSVHRVSEALWQKPCKLYVVMGQVFSRDSAI